MNTHQKLITDFYAAFQNKDWKTMQACYHDEVSFQDPVFPSLKGKDAKAMWHMLTNASKDLILEYNSVEANDHEGSAHWEARYTFSKTGRKVHNIIEAKFEFKDGKIIRHTDKFSFWRWIRMALGTPGLFLGWAPMIRNKVRETAKNNLKLFKVRYPQYQ